ncbi:MAG TPA: helix-turn-helix transcriptional regulator [Chloroflexia bacterium]|nr:helix-turn-helix transcriptional regulator [Chloroflexia bacterium]
MPLTLKEHRNQAHISVRELASKSGISAGTIRRIEAGRYKEIRALTMQNISNALNVHASEIEQFAPFSRELK